MTRKCKRHVIDQKLLDRFKACLRAGEWYTLRSCGICNVPLQYHAKPVEVDTPIETVEDALSEGYIAAGHWLLWEGACGCTVGAEHPEYRPWNTLNFYFDAAHGHVDALTAWVETHEPKTKDEDNGN